MEDYLATLREDLAFFSDNTPSVKREKNKFDAKWTTFDQPRHEKFELSQDGNLLWLSKNGPQSYREFLASPMAANLRRVAQEILTKHSDNHQTYISSPGFLIDDAGGVEGDANQLVLDCLPSQNDSTYIDESRTKIIFLKGEAGSGKTFLLRQMSHLSAQNFLSKQTKSLMFFISAQGRSLSNLQDSLAKEIQDLKIRSFTYKAIPLLTKYRLITPIIDAFDELLGAAGYGDAFGSLQGFLQDLDGKGAMIVSARSAFFETEFRARYNIQTSASFEVIPIELTRWRQAQVESYLRNNDRSGNALSAYSNLSPADGAILSKPFFAAKFLDFCRDFPEGQLTKSGLIDFLMAAYVQRESLKLIGRDGKPLLSDQQQSAFLTECAGYMWANQKRELDRKTVEFLAEYRAQEEELSDDQAQQFITKSVSNAGFESRVDALSFEHEVYFDFFLANQLKTDMSRDESKFGNFLQQGQITTDFARFLISAVDIAEKIKGKLCTSAEGDMTRFGENIRRNRGVLVSTLLSLWPEVCLHSVFREIEMIGIDIDGGQERIKVSDVRFQATRFINSGFRRCSIEDVSFNLCNFERVKLSDVTFKNVQGLHPGLNISGMLMNDRDELWAPKDIADALTSIGWTNPNIQQVDDGLSEKGRAVLGLMRRFAMRTRRANTVVLDKLDNRIGDIITDDQWETLFELLESCGLAKRETMPARGTRKTRLRLGTSPELVLTSAQDKAATSSIRMFWEKIKEV